MQAINRALSSSWAAEKNDRYLRLSMRENDVPCVFISYQRNDEQYAEYIANYIIGKGIDVYFDKNDESLRIANQTKNPKAVTDCIRKGLNQSTHMLVLVSRQTYQSFWVPFEVGFSFDKMGDNQKVLKRNDLSNSDLPAYLKIRDVFTATLSLGEYLEKVFNVNALNIRRLTGKTFYSADSYSYNPLSMVLD
jgi:TIR domain